MLMRRANIHAPSMDLQHTTLPTKVGKVRLHQAKPAPVTYVCDDDAPMLALSPTDLITASQLWSGTVELGETGSGKTSSSGQAIALAMLRAGWGGLVLCAKPDEFPRWSALVKKAGREKSLIVIDGSGSETFNFLDYDAASSPAHLGITNLTQLLTYVLNVASGHAHGGEEGGNPFWQCGFRRKSATDSGMKSATDSDLMSAIPI